MHIKLSAWLFLSKLPALATLTLGQITKTSLEFICNFSGSCPYSGSVSAICSSVYASCETQSVPAFNTTVPDDFNADTPDSNAYTPIFAHINSNTTGSDTPRPFTNNPPFPPVDWVALGDSFAAGPGAGADYDQDQHCKRRQNAYPVDLQNHEYFYGPDPPNMGPSKPRFSFKACTGDVTRNLTDSRNPNYQMAAVTDRTTFTTLSIGGNDIEFVEILKHCVYALVDPLRLNCAGQLARSRGILLSQTFYDNWTRVVQEILDRLNWDRRSISEKRTAIYQTGYSQFFDSYTTQCNDASFIPLIPQAPKMNRELRLSLNRLSHEANYVLQYWIDIFNVRKSVPDNPWTRRRFGTALDFVDFDMMYNNHRFCREGVQEPNRRNPDTWFFHLADGFLRRNNGTIQTNDTIIENLRNDWGKNDNETSLSQPRWNWVIKTFHPKSAGHRASAALMAFKMRYEGYIRELLGKHIKVWVVGDYVPYASQHPNSDIYQGFIPHLSYIFTTPWFYGYLPGSPINNLGIHFLGSQAPPNRGGSAHDCYRRASIDEIHDRIMGSAGIAAQKKVVLLMAGTIDMFYDIDSDNAAQRLSDLISTIFRADKDAVILLGQIPMIGYEDDGAAIGRNGLQQRIIRYNAQISAIANLFRTRYGRRVLKVHTSATTYEHLENDFFLPNREGYKRMAFDFAEAIVLAGAMGWFDDRPGPAVPPPNSAVGSSAQSKHMRAAQQEVGTVVCEQERNYGAPSGKEVTEALFRGRKEKDFFDNVACNTEVMCKNSLTSTDPWSAERTNGTICIYAGGSDRDGPDYTQLMITRPNPTYALNSTSFCSSAIPELIDKCVRDGNSYGGSWVGPDGLTIQLSNLNYPNSPLDRVANYTEPISIDDQKSVVRDGKTLTTGPYVPATPLPRSDDVWV